MYTLSSPNGIENLSTIMKYLVLLGLVFSSSALVKRDASGTSLFQSGKEYVYGYSAALSAGSEDYVSFSSTVNFTGELHIQGGASVLNVQLNNVKLGLHNGEYDFDTNAQPKGTITKRSARPEFEFKTYSQLAPLSEPFAVKVQGGQVKGIALNKNIPIWAQNIQRSIASALQIDLVHVNIGEGSSFQTEEKTMLGDCVTEYAVVPGKDSLHGQIRKFRSHAQCKNLPKRVRTPGISGRYCSDSNSGGVLNSTGSDVYDLEVKDGSLVLTGINVGSAVVYNLFGMEGASQYRLGSTKAFLKEVKTASVAGPFSGESNETNNLKFVFENDEDEDPRNSKPFFQNHDADLNFAGQNKVAEKLIENIKNLHGSLESVFKVFKPKDMESNPNLPLVSALDYTHLKQVNDRLKRGDTTKYTLFLDALIAAGTQPSALVIRDIVQASCSRGKSVSLTDKISQSESDTNILKMYNHDEDNVFILSQPLSGFVRYTGHYAAANLGSRVRGNVDI